MTILNVIQMVEIGNRYIGVCYKNNINLNSEMVINVVIAYRYYSWIMLKKKE